MSKEELKGNKYFEWLYSSRIRIKRRVLRMERLTAKRLSFLIHSDMTLYDDRLQSDLEWLLTWKLKARCCPEYMWCDGVKLQEISAVNRNTVKLKALIWLGPESSEDLLEVPMEGQMVLKATGKQFKEYCFNISYSGGSLVTRKT